MTSQERTDVYTAGYIFTTDQEGGTTRLYYNWSSTYGNQTTMIWIVYCKHVQYWAAGSR